MKLRDLVESNTAKIYYHGTSFTDKGQKILSDGFLKGAEIQGKKHQSPIANRVYLTEDLKYAIVYALGGDYAGGSPGWEFNGGDYGFIFKVNPKDLVNPIPDEDTVGEIISKFGKMERHRLPVDIVPELPDILSYLRSSVTEKQWYDCVEGWRYSSWAAAGKRALKNMPPRIARAILNMPGGHISNEGNIKFYEAWKFAKKHYPEMKRDGSNFFDIAEKVYP